MNFRAMDAVFPIREKYVNLVTNQVQRRQMSIEVLMQFERSDIYVPMLNELSLQGVDEYWSSESSSNGPEMNSADIQS
ncbi:arylsulfatase regulator [Streptococcus sanguinis SK72]|uniref:Arylsulfatase regulator n=1 Tax=Streptococcus sanguinis SK72 TaxID=888809 RepID=F0I4D6_STRSA|nr:arylsulfatase regulator [Streptococcus sanguinis SK72]